MMNTWSYECPSCLLNVENATMARYGDRSGPLCSICPSCAEIAFFEVMSHEEWADLSVLRLRIKQARANRETVEDQEANALWE